MIEKLLFDTSTRISVIYNVALLNLIPETMENVLVFFLQHGEYYVTIRRQCNHPMIHHVHDIAIHIVHSFGKITFSQFYSVLVQTQYLRGVCRFRKPEYGTFESYVSSPCIEWAHRQTKLYADKLPVSRLYINTQYSDRWEPGILELLLKDYKTLTKIVNKLAPVTSVEVNGHLVRARMDKVAVEYVKKGYHLGI